MRACELAFAMSGKEPLVYKIAGGRSEETKKILDEKQISSNAGSFKYWKPESNINNHMPMIVQ